MVFCLQLCKFVSSVCVTDAIQLINVNSIKKYMNVLRFHGVEGGGGGKERLGVSRPQTIDWR